MSRIVTMMALVLAGCAPQVHQVYTPAGTKGSTISCPFGGWSACYQKASELCGPTGYDVFDKSDDRSYHSSFNMYGGSSGTMNLRTMVVACKGQKNAT